MTQALKYLSDKLAIGELPARYCDYIWREDIKNLVSLFSIDGQFSALIRGETTTISGHDALLEFFSGAMNFKPRPYIHNVVVDIISASTARGRCYLDLRSAKNNMDWIGTGFYEDEYKYENDTWKFKSRSFEAVRMDELPDGINPE